jgi:UDP-N-acetyl-D-galactosamine dehydrogenase
MSKIGVIGLGYVGLPLAVEFGKKRKVVGFDINLRRINELKKGIDRTREVTNGELKSAKKLTYTSNPKSLKGVNIFIITVPTPVDEFKKPDLEPIKKASELVGNYLRKDSIVIYESTVFPGCTEEICVPILEKESGLKFNKDFFCGYSPERINPGDKKHKLTSIKKITSGSTPAVSKKVDDLYREIIQAGTHRVSSIRVAEAAKVIENAQRDLNIAFVNELALIFDRMKIDTKEVLEAASTKWNFLPFQPGLVGGHCIGVDPYYLTYKAESIGYRPEVILSGRRINDNMGIFVAGKVIKLLSQKGAKIRNSKVLVLGITFKEDCPDIRNSKVIDVVRELQSYGVKVDVYDPWADAAEVKHEYEVRLTKTPKQIYDGVILAVSHNEFRELNLKKLSHKNTIVYDIKSFFPKNQVTERL